MEEVIVVVIARLVIADPDAAVFRDALYVGIQFEALDLFRHDDVALQVDAGARAVLGVEAEKQPLVGDGIGSQKHVQSGREGAGLGPFVGLEVDDDRVGTVALIGLEFRYDAADVPSAFGHDRTAGEGFQDTEPGDVAVGSQLTDANRCLGAAGGDEDFGTPVVVGVVVGNREDEGVRLLFHGQPRGAGFRRPGARSIDADRLRKVVGSPESACRVAELYILVLWGLCTAGQQNHGCSEKG